MAGFDKNTPIPTEIKLHQKSRLMEVTFADGKHFQLTYEFLRVYSPSAEVRGHGPGQEVLQIGKKDVEITNLEPVGNYAVQPTFSDGHDTRHLLLGLSVRLGEHQRAVSGSSTCSACRLAGASRRSRDVDPVPSGPQVRGCSRRLIPRHDGSNDTHFGFEKVDETREGQARRRRVLLGRARSYDVMNDLMSLGLHRLWKAFTIEISGVQAGRAGARRRRRHRRPGAWLSPGASARRARSGSPTSTAPCSTSRPRPPARRGRAAAAGAVRRREDCRSRRIISTASASPSACAT